MFYWQRALQKLANAVYQMNSIPQTLNLIMKVGRNTASWSEKIAGGGQALLEVHTVYMYTQVDTDNTLASLPFNDHQWMSNWHE